MQKLTNDNKQQEQQDKHIETESKKTSYQSNGRTMYFITESNTQTGKKLKRTYYQEDGKTIDYIALYDPTEKWDKVLKEIHYKDDGKIVDYVYLCDRKTNDSYTVYYNPDGTIKEIKKN
ncbi:MAG: DUF2963 domain-containing protein [Candidatus Phytoplasma sp. TWB_XP]